MGNDIDVGVCDAEAARLLPWYVSERLSVADAERVTQHLRQCGICRSDLADQRSLRAALRAGDSIEYAPQTGLAKTLARIDELTRESDPRFADVRAARGGGSLQRRFGVTQWLAAAVIVQAVGLGVIGGWALIRPAGDGSPGRYETLSSTATLPNGQRIRAVFAESTTVGQLKELLATHHLLIVAGPSEAGVFTLAVTDAATSGSLEEFLAGLRSDAHVLLAEPVATDGLAKR